MMNLNKLSRAGEKIKLSDEAKKRIINECSRELPDNTGEYTDHVMTVERYKPRRFARAAGVAAAFVLAAGGVGATVFTVKNMGSEPGTSKYGASVESSNNYRGTAVKEPVSIEYTHLRDYFEHKANGSGKLLSDSQRERIYDLLKSVTYTELDGYEVSVPRTRIMEYDICENDFYNDGHYYFFVEGDSLFMNEESTLQPKTDNRQYYRLSEDIEERFNAIYDEKFGPVLDNEFYFSEEGDLDAAAQSEIREYLKNLQYTDSYTKIGDQASYENVYKKEDEEYDSAYKLHYSSDGQDCTLYIMSDELRFTAAYTDAKGEKQHLVETCKVVGSDNVALKVLSMKCKSDFREVFDKDFILDYINVPGEFSYVPEIDGVPQELDEEHREKIREVILSANYEYTDEEFPENTDDVQNAFISYSDDEYLYTVWIAGDLVKFNRYSKNGGNDLINFTLKSDDLELPRALTGGLEVYSTTESKTVNRNGSNYPDWLDDSSKRFDMTCYQRMLLLLNNKFYCLNEGDLDYEARSKIHAYIASHNYEDSTAGSDVEDMNVSANIDLNYSCEDYTCKLTIIGSYFTYSVDHRDKNGGMKHYEERFTATDWDNAAEELLEMIK